MNGDQLEDNVVTRLEEKAHGIPGWFHPALGAMYVRNALLVDSESMVTLCTVAVPRCGLHGGDVLHRHAT